MKFATLPRILRRRLETSTSQSTKSLRLPRETHRFGASSNPPRLPTFLQPSRTPAYFATRQTFLQPSRTPAISCACHVFCNASKSLRLPRETQFEGQKMSRAPGVLTILTSKSCSRAGVVQILPTSTSKSAPMPSVFNDFDFQIAVSCRVVQILPTSTSKSAPNPQFLTILTSKSLSRAGKVQILATSTSKSAPTLSVFNDFDFQIAVSRRRGANFVTASATDPPHPPVLRS